MGLKVKLIRISAWIWIGVFSLSVFAGLLGIVLSAPSIPAGLLAAVTVLSPFNLAEYIVSAIVLSPAIGLLILAKRLENRAK